ncbi:MAG: flagellar FliJ family protein [Planctomycetes bacterium]|nr:flagellar FliJ family protein [Planctomycetota bacterium]
MAKRFRFRLEPVLRLRRRAAEQQMRVVAVQMRHVAGTREAMKELRRQVLETLARSRNERGRAEVDVGTQLQEQRWRLHLRRRIARQEERIVAAGGALLEAQNKLAELSKQVKVIEKLRERQYRTFTESVDLLERLEMDEIATQRFVRRPRMGWGTDLL